MIMCKCQTEARGPIAGGAGIQKCRIIIVERFPLSRHFWKIVHYPVLMLGSCTTRIKLPVARVNW
jgi:hypothetical protein